MKILYIVQTFYYCYFTFITILLLIFYFNKEKGVGYDYRLGKTKYQNYQLVAFPQKSRK